MSKTLKLLVCGDVCGRFTQLFSRVAAIQKKAGQFDLMFCVGNFFGDEDNDEWKKLVSGEIKAPIATLVLGPNKESDMEHFSDIGGCELCENVTYLGRRGVYTGSSGLTVAYLSGVEHTGADSKAAKDGTHFTAVDIAELRESLVNDSKFHGVDLLLTSQWPAGVEKYASAVEGVDTKACGSLLVSQLALTVKPRYHFCALEGVSYERQPYRNHRVLRDSAQHVTRFIALAEVGNEHKRKYMYAFNVVPLRHIDTAELTKQPTDVTECPYKLDATVFKSARSSGQESKPAQYFYDQQVIERGTTSTRGKRKSQGATRDGAPQHKKPAQPTGPCWFCLASPEVEKHLVVSVGTQCYLALAKGGLTEDHILILPVGHYSSTVSAPSEVIEELEQYKSALRKCFSQFKKVVVFFERNYKTSHLQIQAVPVDATSMDIMAAFTDCAQKQNIELHEIPTYSDLKQIVPAGAPYFYAELPGDIKLLYRISKGFPLQFGREAMSHQLILNMPDRINWKSCLTSKDRETEMASRFRQTFKNYDFTL